MLKKCILMVYFDGTWTYRDIKSNDITFGHYHTCPSLEKKKPWFLWLLLINPLMKWINEWHTVPWDETWASLLAQWGTEGNLSSYRQADVTLLETWKQRSVEYSKRGKERFEMFKIWWCKWGSVAAETDGRGL